MYLYKFIKYSKEAVGLACEEMLIQGDLEAVAFLKSNIKDERMMTLVVCCWGVSPNCIMNRDEMETKLYT